MNIARIMLPKALTVFLYEDHTIRQALEIGTRAGYTALPVLDKNDLYVGSVTEGDILRFMMEQKTTDLHVQEKHRIKEIIRPEFCPALSIDSDDDTVIDTILNYNYAPVVDDRNALCGIMTRRRLIAYLAGRELST